MSLNIKSNHIKTNFNQKQRYIFNSVNLSLLPGNFEPILIYGGIKPDIELIEIALKIMRQTKVKEFIRGNI